MNTEQLIAAVNKLPKDATEWDSALLAQKIKPILLGLIDAIPTKVEVKDTEIESLSKDILDNLRVGDFVVKVTGNQKHSYIVTYKGDGAGEGLVLTYNACGYGEAIAYDRTESGWAFNSKEVKTYGA